MSETVQPGRFFVRYLRSGENRSDKEVYLKEGNIHLDHGEEGVELARDVMFRVSRNQELPDDLADEFQQTFGFTPGYAFDYARVKDL